MLTSETGYTPSQQTIKPVMALVFHSSTLPVEANIKGDMITSHMIQDGKIQAGELVSTKKAGEFFENLLGKTDKKIQTASILPENILVNTANLLIWYTKSQVKDLWFKTSHTFTNLPNARIPALVWIYHKNSQSLSIFATATNKRPTLNTKLYRAPFCNIGHTGVLCQGSSKLPDYVEHLELNSFIQGCESSLFDSNFTHVNNNFTFSSQLVPLAKKSNNGVSTSLHIKAWTQLVAEDKKPNAKQMTYFKTLGEVLAK